MTQSALPLILSIGEAMIELAPLGDGRYARGFAGDTFNTIWHLAHLLRGRAQTGFVSRVGRDEYSDAFVASLSTDGIATTGISRDANRTMGLYLIERDGVERRFHYWRTMSAARNLARDPDALARAVTGATLVHLSGITLAILSPAARGTLFTVLATLRMQGARLSFDPNIRPRLWPSPRVMRDTVARMLTITDIALPSFDDEARDWGDPSPGAVIDRYRAAGVAEIAVKDGAGPVFHCHDGQYGQTDTPRVGDIRDTTGAGDAFNAGYLAARLAGQPPAFAVGLGQDMAATVIGTYGARADRAAITALAGRLPVNPAGPGWTVG